MPHITPRILATTLAIASLLSSMGEAAIVTYSLGNSLTGSLARNNRLGDLTQGEGPNQVAHDSQVRGSTNLSTFLSTPSSPSDFLSPMGNYVQAFANNSLDVVTLQPFYNATIREEANAAAQIVQQLRANPANADTRVMILATWPQLTPPDTFQQQWATSGLNLDSGFIPSAQAFDLFMQELRLSVPDAEIIPVGHVFNEIASLTTAPNSIPGLNSIYDLFGDLIHVNNGGAYVEALVGYSMIYGKSPQGLPYPDSFNESGGGPPLPTASIAPIQSIVWDISQPFIAVPEPNSFLVVGTALAFLLRRRRIAG
jgi:hypothetical protein